MPPRKNVTSRDVPESPEETRVPDVIVDFRFEQGLLYMALVNISEVPAYRVSVKFDKAFRGLGGSRDMCSLRLFRNVHFLAPHKRIETLLDFSSAYFQRREPTLIKANINFRDARGNVRSRQVIHDLKIYQEVAYLVSRETGPALSFPAAPPATLPVTRSTEESTYGNLKRQSLLQFQLPR